MAEGRAELGELLLGLRGVQELVGRGRRDRGSRQTGQAALGHRRERRHGLQRHRVSGGWWSGQRRGDEMGLRSDQITELGGVGEGEGEIVPR